MFDFFENARQQHMQDIDDLDIDMFDVSSPRPPSRTTSQSRCGQGCLCDTCREEHNQQVDQYNARHKND